MGNRGENLARKQRQPVKTAPTAGATAINKRVDSPRREQNRLVEGEAFEASAVMVGERIDVKGLPKLPVVAQSPLMVRLPGAGVAALFRYGVITFFDEQPGDREWLMSCIADHVFGQGEAKTEERIRVTVAAEEEEGPGRGKVVIHSANRDRLQLLAEAMAKSTILAFHEIRAAGDFDRIEPLAMDLAEDGKFSVKPRELLKAVGGMLLSEHRLTGRAEVLDKPDLLWDNPHLEGLYARLASDYELEDRSLAIERKLGTLSRTAETLVETVRYQSSHRLELYIVLMILMELALSIYGHLSK